MTRWIFVALVAACGSVRTNATPDAGGDDGSSATCRHDTDCDVAHPHCAPDGTCVACQIDADCTDPSAPVCETTTHSCRGCAADSECTGGVCIESTGTCTADAEVAFVANTGTDTGNCSRAAPCLTLPFAVAHLAGRPVLHILGGTLDASNVALSANVILDGEHTILGSVNGPALTIAAPATVTLEGLQFVEPALGVTGDALAINGAASVLLYDVELAGDSGQALLVNNEATLHIIRSHIGNLTSTNTHLIDCENSTIVAEQNLFEKSNITNFNGGTCDVTARRNSFHSNRDGCIQVSDGHLVAENNLIVNDNDLADSMFANNLSPGSTIRFNTFVNTTPQPSDGAALGCDATVLVTSNVFTYNSAHPIVGQGCATRYSVFDTVATTAAGTGNRVADIATIFTDRANGDYRPSATSVARGSAEPGQETMVDIDFDGNPRPNPGPTADCGAFEVP
jgi:hypothetical protein